jgi:GNAT superfamily N-acetyltransferase
MADVNIQIVRTDASSLHFQALVQQLDADLAIRDGAEHGFYHQFNSISMLHHVVLVYVNDLAVSCGAFKPFDEQSVEVKRMYTLPAYRGRKLAEQVLTELETWAKVLGYTNCVLETGKKQPEAIRLYERCGYSSIPNYGQYIGVENSICFGKKLVE